MGTRILLADDSITIQKVVNLTFADEGIEVVSVSNGDMAERRLGEVNPDLVLADIFMPGKNGYELCESIKQSSQFSNVPVVLLVGAFEPFDQAEARRVRADAHLTKPFESRTLVETVRKLISSSGQQRTGSLARDAVAAQPDERHAEEKAHGHSPAQAAIESAPPAQGQRAEENAQPLEIELAPAPHQEQPDQSSALPWMEQMESLADVSAAHERHSDPFDLAPLEASAHEPGEAHSIAGVETRDTTDLMLGGVNGDLDLEGPDHGFPAEFAIEDDEMILDLDGPEGVYTQEPGHASGVDVAADRGFDFNSGGLQGQTVQASSWADSDVFKTQMLEPPARLSHAEERVNTNPLEMPPGLDFSRSSASPVGLAELHEETASSTLLAVDDPLGDVLMDEREMGVQPYEAHRPAQVLFDEQTANEEFNLEFNPQEQQVFDIPDPTATAAKITGELAEANADTSEQSAVAFGAIEQGGESYAPREEAVAEAQPQSADEAAVATPAFEPYSSAPGETSVDATQSGASADWSESGFEFNSEFQTATPERRPNQVEYMFSAPEERSGEGRAQASVPEFTTSAMWTEEDARFAPIDIEATPVDESEPARGVAERDAAETGFEIAPAVEERPTHTADAPVAEASPEAQSPTAEAAPQTADLPPALIDEIVRRVVSQMSESVVREIAWEVVPDVVERVIKGMAREEVSKRI